jgi:hypothetical protein
MVHVEHLIIGQFKHPQDRGCFMLVEGINVGRRALTWAEVRWADTPDWDIIASTDSSEPLSHFLHTWEWLQERPDAAY